MPTPRREPTQREHRSATEELADSYEDQCQQSTNDADSDHCTGNDVRQQVDHHADEDKNDQNFHGLTLQRMRNPATVEITVLTAIVMTATWNANSMCSSPTERRGGDGEFYIPVQPSRQS